MYLNLLNYCPNFGKPDDRKINNIIEKIAGNNLPLQKVLYN